MRGNDFYVTSYGVTGHYRQEQRHTGLLTSFFQSHQFLREEVLLLPTNCASPTPQTDRSTTVTQLVETCKGSSEL